MGETISSRGEKVQTAIGFIILIVIALLIGKCVFGGRPSQPAPPHPIIRKTGYESATGQLDLDIDFVGVPRDGELIERAATEARGLGMQIAAGRPPVSGPLDTITLTFLGPAGDDKLVGRKILYLDYDANQLSDAAKSGASAQDILGLATDGGVWAPSNKDVVVDYCGRSDASQVFCNRYNQ